MANFCSGTFLKSYNKIVVLYSVSGLAIKKLTQKKQKKNTYWWVLLGFLNTVAFACNKLVRTGNIHSLCMRNLLNTTVVYSILHCSV